MKYNPLLKYGFQEVGGGVDYVYNKTNYQNFGINPIAQALSAAAMATNNMLFYAILVQEDCTIERLRISISIGVAGSSVWGVYDMLDGKPNNLLFQSTAFDNSVTATQEYILGTPYNIKKGIYFIAYNTTSSPTLRCVQAYTLPSVFGDTIGYDGPRVLAGYAYAYTGTMPATASAPTTYYTVGSAPLMPHVQFKIS